jgi:hypothetical protein
VTGIRIRDRVGTEQYAFTLSVRIRTAAAVPVVARRRSNTAGTIIPGKGRVNGALVNAVGNAVVISIGIRGTAPAVAGEDLGRIRWAAVITVRGTVAIGVSIGFSRALVDTVRDTVLVAVNYRFRDSAPADTGLNLVGISGAAIFAVSYAIAIGISIRYATTTLARIYLIIIIGTGFVAIKDAIRVSIFIQCIAPAFSWLEFVGIIGAAIITVRGAVPIGVHDVVAPADIFLDQVWIIVAEIVAGRCPVAIRIDIQVPHAPAGAGRGLVGVRETAIDAIGSAIAIAVGIRNAAPACPGCSLGRIRRTEIGTVRDSVAVTVSLCNAAAAGTGSGLVWG